MVKALPSSCGSKTATISLNEAGIKHAPAIPLMARMTKKEYRSGKKEMINDSAPSDKKPYAKTGLALHKSLTRPQNKRKAAKVTA
jgi:hypothetical protein